MGLFSKLKAVLTKTRDGLSKKLTELFAKNKLGEEFYEELEDILISADVSVKTTMEIVDEIRDTAIKEKCRDKDYVIDMLKNELFRLGKLALEVDGTYTPFSGEAIKYALEMVLLGMGMIFAVLGVLWGVLAIFKLVFARPQKEKKVEPKKAEPSPAPTVAPAPASAQCLMLSTLPVKVELLTMIGDLISKPRYDVFSFIFIIFNFTKIIYFLKN